MVIQQSRPPARTWLLAAAELVAALVVTGLIVRSTRPPTVCHHHHHQHGVTGVPKASAPLIHWGWVECLSLGVAVVALGWWLGRRRASTAVVSAAALAVFAASPAVRGLASQSHLVAMAALELLMVACPLLLLRTRPVPSVTPPARRLDWTMFALLATLSYAALLVVIHLPAVHRRGAEAGTAPLWVALTALAVGVFYWFGVLRTADRVAPQARRVMLFAAQEVAAFIGLLSLFGAWGATAHTSAWDQRLGGLLMMATCAAVTIPLAREIR